MPVRCHLGPVRFRSKGDLVRTHAGSHSLSTIEQEILKIILCMLAVCLVIPYTLKAQAPGTGAITGRVFDPSGALIAAAHVSVVNEETNWSRALTSDAEGQYRASLLPPGSYSVVAEATGFKRLTLRSVRVGVAETAVVDIKLEVGAAKSEVQVRASTELAQTESASLGRTTNGTTILALPLANRNFSQILALSPGVIAAVPNA